MIARRSAAKAIAAVRGGMLDEGAIDELTKVSVAWVLANPTQVQLPPPAYRR